MRGLNTEIQPQFLGAKPFSYRQFRNLTSRSGALVPTPTDGTHSTLTWEEQQVGTNSVAGPFIYGTQGSGYFAYCNLNGLGNVFWRTPGGGTGPIAYAAPGTAPAEVWITPFGTEIGDPGGIAIPYGQTVTVAPAWTVGDPYYHTGLGPPLQIVHDIRSVLVDITAGSAELGSTAGYGLGINGPSGGGLLAGWLTAGAMTMDLALRSMTGTIASGDVLTWGSTGTGTALENANTENWIWADIAIRGTPPAGVTGWQLYVLSGGGYYYKDTWGTGATGTTAYQITLRDIDTTNPERLYDGPLDAQGLPEDLIDPGVASLLAKHKGSLLAASGAVLRWSEPALIGNEVRWFRKDFYVQLPADIDAIISRKEHAEIWTSRGVWYLVGGPPNFELRDSEMNEYHVSAKSIIPTDRGTFYLGRDGIRLMSGGQSVNVLSGNNTPWVEALGTAALACVGGASRGKYFLTGTDGTGLVYDWEAEEIRERVFPESLLGMYWSDVEAALVAKTESNLNLTVETQSGDQDWVVEYPRTAYARSQRLPAICYLDSVGTFTFDLYVDDTLMVSIPISGEQRQRIWLPRLRGSTWWVVLRGTGSQTDTAIRQMEFR